MKQDKIFMREAIALSLNNMNTGEGGPFGCVIVKNGVIIGRGNNRVTSTNDPTAHAEIVAIRDACRYLNSFQLEDCTIYTSCEPCPMCLGAIYWARPARIVYACTREDAAAIDFDDDFLYKELVTPLSERVIPIEPLLRKEGLVAFNAWKNKNDKKVY
ncbi:MAG: nucleoside deaminase [Saprospiraceae bacterium]|nr:nucleoside deaminase [Saprospiraceae bacterium]